MTDECNTKITGWGDSLKFDLSDHDINFKGKDEGSCRDCNLIIDKTFLEGIIKDAVSAEGSTIDGKSIKLEKDYN